MQRCDTQSSIHSNLNPDQLHELFMNLEYFNSYKNLQITQMQWSAEASRDLSKMLVSNYGLKSIDLDGTPDTNCQKIVLSGLNRNFDIIQFNMPCGIEFQRRFKRILERNFQFRITQRMLVDKLIASTTCKTQHIKDIFDGINNINHTEATADEVSEVLFHAYMRTQFDFPEISESIQGVITTLKKLKRAGRNNDVTALQAAAALNMADYVTGLAVHGADIDSQNILGQTALLTAALDGKIEVVKILCEHGADKSLKSNTGVNAFHAAVYNRWDEIADYLQPDASPDMRQRILSKRNLIIGFNPRLFQSLPEFDDATIRSYGGGNREGFALLAEYLDKFSQLHESDTKMKCIAVNFHTAVDNVCQPANIKLAALDKNGILHFMTGCIHHMAGITIKKTLPTGYQLMIADRGLFYANDISSESDDEDQQQPCLRSIKIPDKHILSILTMLESAAIEIADAAENILFTEIPRLVKSKWKYHAESTHSTLKSGVCFFGNIKPLLRHEFQQAYNRDEGFKKYKEFTSFLRTALRHDYAKYADSDDPYLFIANKRIEEKYAHRRFNFPAM